MEAGAGEGEGRIQTSKFATCGRREGKEESRTARHDWLEATHGKHGFGTNVVVDPRWADGYAPATRNVNGMYLWPQHLMFRTC